MILKTSQRVWEPRTTLATQLATTLASVLTTQVATTPALGRDSQLATMLATKLATRIATQLYLSTLVRLVNTSKGQRPITNKQFVSPDALAQQFYDEVS